MTNPFLAEIRIFAGNFAPSGWAFCDGQLMPISQNTALFSLLGTYFGGNGSSTFGLPQLQGSAPLGAGQGSGLTLRALGATGGEQSVTLTPAEMAAHSHAVEALGSAGDQASPADNALAESSKQRFATDLYATQAGTAEAGPTTGATGGGAAHNNMPPYLAVTFIIALQGVSPARS
jgi:microcystin-dependent protein